MTRIVSGSAKGQTLLVPKSGTRPTSERVREALFSRLEHYGYIKECVVLDLFAGSGALAFEALSRGASDAVCVEANPGAAKIILQNARKLNLPVKVASQKVATYLCNTVPVTKFDLVFIDPPYDLDESALTEVLAGLELHLKDDAMVIVERAKRTPEPNWPDFLRLDDERSWGDTRIWTAVNSASASQ